MSAQLFTILPVLLALSAALGLVTRRLLVCFVFDIISFSPTAALWLFFFLRFSILGIGFLLLVLLVSTRALLSLLWRWLVCFLLAGDSLLLRLFRRRLNLAISTSTG